MPDDPEVRGAAAQTTERRSDAAGALAELFGMGSAALLDLIGGGWKFAVVGHRASRVPRGDALLGGERRRWFVAGEPPQVLIGVPVDSNSDDLITCHTAEVDWDCHIPYLEPGRLIGSGTVRDARVWLPEAVLAAQRARRRRFRWCPLCRTLTAPENLTDGVCHGCATKYRGITY